VRSCQTADIHMRTCKDLHGRGASVFTCPKFSIASPCFYTRLDMVCGCFTSLFLRVIHAMSTDGMFSHSSLGSCSPSSKDYFIHAQKSLEDFTAKNTRPSGFRRARHPFSNTTAGQNFSLTNNLTSWFL
jgi:hypothetical protein